MAQLLDHGSWVQDLTNEQVRGIYAAYARSRDLPEELDEAYALRFGGSTPEALNSTHALTVVASEMDAATERIVTYLATGYGVPINVLFFRYFVDEGRSYLARTWLLDDVEDSAPSPGKKGREKQEPWNGTDWFSRTLRSLPVGARIFTHIPKAGYVGVGTVSGEAQPFEDAALTVDGESRQMTGLTLKGTYRAHDGAADAEGGQDRREWIVPVDWAKAVPREQALWRTGFFANQNSACKLRAHGIG